MTCLAVCAAMRPNSMDSISFFDDLADLRARLLLLDVLDGDLGGGVLVVLVGDDVPTTESLVAAVMTIDLDAQVDLVLETFLGGGRQSQLQRLENHAGRYALFVGYRLNNQQYFFAHCTPRLSIHWIRGFASQSKRGMMLALSIESIGSRYS